MIVFFCVCFFIRWTFHIIEKEKGERGVRASGKKSSKIHRSLRFGCIYLCKLYIIARTWVKKYTWNHNLDLCTTKSARGYTSRCNIHKHNAIQVHTARYRGSTTKKADFFSVAKEKSGDLHSWFKIELSEIQSFTWRLHVAVHNHAQYTTFH